MENIEANAPSYEAIAEKELIKRLNALADDERFPDLPSHRFFTDKQWDALCESIPMTQEIFDRCLYVCDRVSDSVMFHQIVEQFPHLEVNYSIEVQEHHKQVHDEFKAAYLKKWGNDAVMFRD
jgi:hypothetical protein